MQSARALYSTSCRGLPVNSKYTVTYAAQPVVAAAVVVYVLLLFVPLAVSIEEIITIQG